MSLISFSEYSPSSKPNGGTSHAFPKVSGAAATPFNAVQSHAVLASASPFHSTPPISSTTDRDAAKITEGFDSVPVQFQTGYGASGGTGHVDFDYSSASNLTTKETNLSTLYSSMGMGLSPTDATKHYTITDPALARKYEMDPSMQSSVYQDSTRARLQDTQLYINEENNFNIIATLSISTLIMAAIVMGSQQ